MTTRRRTLLLAAGLLVAATTVSVGVRSIRHRLFPWTANRVLEITILTYPPWGFTVATVTAGQPVEIDAGAGRVLGADYFAPVRKAGRARGCILLVHGSIPKGRRFSPYRFIARDLAAGGYHVLLPDIGGYGASQLAADALPSFGRDVTAAAGKLATLAGPDAAAGIDVIAHSLGASMALMAVVHHGLQPRKLVIWDPPINGEISHAVASARQSLERFRGELQVVGGGRSRVSDAALLDYYQRLEPLGLLQTLRDAAPGRARPRVLAALGSLIRDHSALVKEIGVDTGWLTVLDLTGVDHFLNMVSLGGNDRYLLYRTGDYDIFKRSVVAWIAKPELGPPSGSGR